MDVRPEFRVARHLELYLGPIRLGDCAMLASAIGVATATALTGTSTSDGIVVCGALVAALIGLHILNSTGLAAMRVPTKEVLRAALHTSCAHLLVVGELVRSGPGGAAVFASAVEFLVLPIGLYLVHSIRPGRFFCAQLVSGLTIVGGILGLGLAIVIIAAVIMSVFWTAPWELFR